MTGFVEKVKEAVPGTTENKLAKGTDGVTGHHQHSAGATGLTGGDGYASTTTGGAAYGSGAAAPEYGTTGVGGTAPVTGAHHGHSHHHGGHHHGHHGHHTTGATNVDTPAETGTEKITKHLPGTEANKEHKANENLGGAGGYGSTTNTGAGYGSTTGTGTGYGSTGTGTGYGSTPNTGLANEGATGYGTAGHGATGAGFGTVDTSRESTAQGVAKHVPGTDAHREHTANTSGGYGTTGGVTGTTATGLGGNTTVGTDHETTKDKLLKIIPGTEQHKEKKALKEGGL